MESESDEAFAQCIDVALANNFSSFLIQYSTIIHHRSSPLADPKLPLLEHTSPSTPTFGEVFQIFFVE